MLMMAARGRACFDDRHYQLQPGVPQSLATAKALWDHYVTVGQFDNGIKAR
jgi:hypothetical protein